MNQKISRNKKHKYSNKKKLTLGEEEDTSTLINIAPRRMTVFLIL